jgi:hypothetical protein
MQNLSRTVEAYVAMWNERDPTCRADLISTAWSADGCYLDPQFEAVGHDALGAMVATAQRQFPDHDLRLASPVDAHHDQVRFAWEVIAPDGSASLTGMDIGSLDSDGRLSRIVGFFGVLPAVGAT